ncbi:hypothetical protein BHECKSOX_860 [Bathymodiolus heckerae thiotrophic gill symbiont]|uniref:hypothetical protein n=1 Tax=Bathymodiolus heckerae thiotrophic gill symbiont TaxID=1052212 RepID=UPI0010B611B8|nr:hypothetical protein [Bathymodiolus heckerae thiotrophic gill symbiont]SHN92448.1 hypothetical protein BHECKSOX_860 [Bathymodiolus heckerae thiotrophic gill symbiont]
MLKTYKEKKAHRTERKIDHYISIKEDYWHKSVILPMFIDKFVYSVTNWITSINELNAKDIKIEKTRDNFKKDIRELCSRTHLLCTVDENVRENIRIYLDEIKDCVTAHLSNLKEGITVNNGGSSINEKILIKIEEILKELMNDHNSFISDD